MRWIMPPPPGDHLIILTNKLTYRVKTGLLLVYSTLRMSCTHFKMNLN